MDQETKVLKGGEFVISSSEPDHLFVPEDTNEEQKMIRQSCRDFVFSEVQKKGNEIANQHDLLKAAAELGLLGAHIPEQYGGTELDTNTNTMILEELGKGGGSYDTSFAAHTGIGMLPILYYGTEEQKKKYLPPMSDGSLIGAYCLTEPGSGSDALAAKSHAELTEDGKHYQLNGQKMWISNAGFAGVFIVFAKIDGEKFTAFIVDRDSDGVTLGEEEDKLGIKGSSTRQVFFENVQVPVDNVLGEIGKGHHIAFAVLNIGRFKLGAMCMGGSKLACEIGIKYANDRQQFGKPIATFGAIRYKIAEQAIRIFALESAVYRVSQLMQEMRAQMVAEGMDYATSLQKSAEEYSVECAIIKVVGSEVLDYVVDELVQIHGGYGFSEEYKPAGIYRDSRINRIYEGTNEINRLLMVNMLLRKAEKGDLNLKDPAWDVQKELTKMPSFEKPSGKWAAETTAVENMKKIFLLTSGAAVKYQMDGKHDLRNEQMVLTNIADILIDMFVAESLLLRVQKSVGEENEELYRAILSTTISDAQYRIAKNAKDALHSFAGGDELRVMSMGVDRFTKYPHPNIKENRELVAAKLIESNAYSL